MSDSRTPADMTAIVKLNGGLAGIIHDDDFRSDALPDRERWADLLTENLSDSEHEDGIYELEILVQPRFETDPTRDLHVSFRDHLTLYYTGLLAIQEGHVRPAMSLVPTFLDVEGKEHTLSETALNDWSYDLQDLADAYAEGADAHDLIHVFLQSHHG